MRTLIGPRLQDCCPILGAANLNIHLGRVAIATLPFKHMGLLWVRKAKICILYNYTVNVKIRFSEVNISVIILEDTILEAVGG